MFYELHNQINFQKIMTIFYIKFENSTTAYIRQNETPEKNVSHKAFTKPTKKSTSLV